MAELTYMTNLTLDGFIEDADGDINFNEGKDDFLVFITDLLRDVGTCLYGRRLYEAMAMWETNPALAEVSELRADFANVWQAPDKVVYSTTLQAAPTARTRIERTFDPEAVREMKRSATRDLTIGGANLAAQAFAAGLVDECHLFVCPVIVGGGKPGFPKDVRAELELVDERRFSGGVLYLRYRVAT